MDPLTPLSHSKLVPMSEALVWGSGGEWVQVSFESEEPDSQSWTF